MNNLPLVSICTITYNHAPFIRQCLDGFLMQKTNFPFEVLIHDDASTDGTEEIIREYEAKYPELIKPLYEKENQYLKGRRGSKIFNFPRARGKYIALCEGDDYWTDPLKLQKQVEFLEANPDYGMVHTDFDIYDVKKGILTKNAIAIQKPKLEWQEGAEFVKWYVGGFAKIITCTICYRKSVYDQHYDLKDQQNVKVFGDIILFCTIGGNSKVKYFVESTSVKNNLPESASQSQNYRKSITTHNHIADAFEYFGKKFNVPEFYYLNYQNRRAKEIIKIGIQNRDFEAVKEGMAFKSIKINMMQKVYYYFYYVSYPVLGHPLKWLFKMLKRFIRK
jgi:glycosyltransferase involved in cell wall biosynthesis